MKLPIRVAIIGAGIGREHLNAYRALPDEFKVVTLCDLDTQKAAEVIADDSISLESDYRIVLQEKDIDLIDICLPPNLHYNTVKSALAAGKQVICEKPLVTSLKEAIELVDASAQVQRRIFPVFQYRYGRAMSQLQELINKDMTGRPFAASLETHWNRGADYYAVPWRGTWKGEQGGAVLGHAIHNHDFLTQIMGSVKRLSAFTTTRVNDIETEDCAAIAFEMDNGAVATSSITLGAATDTTRLRFCFEKLTAESGSLPYAPAIDTWTFTARKSEDQARVDQAIQSVGEVNSGYVGFFKEIANALSGKTSNEVSIEAGVRSIELVSAIYQSASSQRWVTLPLGVDDANYSGWILT